MAKKRKVKKSMSRSGSMRMTAAKKRKAKSKTSARKKITAKKTTKRRVLPSTPASEPIRVAVTRETPGR